jgi:hypothetical protein
MGLDMHTKRKIIEVTYRRYQKAGKKEKGKILDEFRETTGYNRDYAAHVLANWGKARYLSVDGKRVRLVAGAPRKRRKGKASGKKGGRPKKYTGEFLAVLIAVWKFLSFKCGKLLAPTLALMIDFLAAAKGTGGIPEIDKRTRELLLSVSPATIDRLLRKEKKKLELKGRGLTKPGPLLKHQIPIRTFFSWDERKPGFFEQDTVAHCGNSGLGQFCSTLTLTDVFSGWTEERALRNRAHRWVKENIAEVHDTLPFPMLGLDDDNGGEFINNQLLTWCRENRIQFTRGRPYRKNDNCFVEQKNGDVVRKTVGYYRFDTDEEFAALKEVYRYLCPLINHWYPTIKLIGKERRENGRYKKVYEKTPKTPYLRLMESPDVSKESKAALRRTHSTLNPVELKLDLDKAVARLLHINRKKADTMAEKQTSGSEVFG